MGKKFKFKSSKTVKKSLFNFIDEQPQIAGTVGTHIELFSNRQMVIEGCRGVCDYSSEYLKLKLIKGYAEISGNGLDIFLYEDSSITVNGEILNIEFCV